MKRGRAILALTVFVLSTTTLAALGIPPDLARIQPSAVVLDRDGEILRAFITPDGMWRLPSDRDSVDPLYLSMLFAYEDRRFFWHPGIDPLALGRALGQWIAQGRVVSGASTLTMQAARLLSPRPHDFAAKSHNFATKIRQMARAVQLEAHLSKARILDIYLTLAPFGGNIEGVRAASLTWFGKEPRRLTPGEAALLVVLPQAPAKLRPDHHPEQARAARDKVLARMQTLGVLTATQAAEAREERIPTERRLMPFVAPHLAERLVARYGSGVQQSFINGELQRSVELLAQRRQESLDESSTLAIMVVARKEREVIAYLGASDYFDFKRHGTIDMIAAVRSPGSTLKPFLYAMAFDDLVLQPETVIRDVPTSFGDYSPGNFHGGNAGDVTARVALQDSLNIPAVAVLDRVGPVRFAARLREVGVKLSFGNGASPGLPMILGGVGTSLGDLALLYTALANGGLSAPLRLSPADPVGPKKRVLSEAAVWQVSDILAGAPLPTDMGQAGEGIADRRIAFKTGTSYGFRDAWAFGYDINYTVGVWIGRPDGTPSPGRFGRNSAAPILFDTFELLPKPPATLSLPAPPPGVLIANTTELPPALQRFRESRGQAGTPALAIIFPANGTVLDLASARDGVQVTVKGGRRPFSWLANGQPIEGQPIEGQPIEGLPWRHDVEWRPDGVGGTHLSVIDVDGQSATSDVWLR